MRKKDSLVTVPLLYIHLAQKPSLTIFQAQKHLKNGNKS